LFQRQSHCARPSGGRGELRRLQEEALHRRADRLDRRDFRQESQAHDVPVIVDFWAPWCGPCRAMAPIFDRAAKELEPRVRFAKVNVDEEPAIAGRYGIRGIPTLIAFDHGKVAKQHAGLVDMEFLRRLAG